MQVRLSTRFRGRSCLKDVNGGRRTIFLMACMLLAALMKVVLFSLALQSACLKA